MSKTPKIAAKVNEQEYVLASPDQFTPLPGNARESDEKLVEASLDAHGFYGAILVQKSTNHIVVGNNRWEIAKAKGMKQIPALIVDLTDEQALGIALADNRTGDIGSYFEDRLSTLLESIQSANPTDGLARAGYTDADLERLQGEADDVDQLLAELGTADPDDDDGDLEDEEDEPEAKDPGVTPLFDPKTGGGMLGVMHGKSLPMLRFRAWRILMLD